MESSEESSSSPGTEEMSDDVSTAAADYEDGSHGLICLNAWSSVELFGKD